MTTESVIFSVALSPDLTLGYYQVTTPPLQQHKGSQLLLPLSSSSALQVGHFAILERIIILIADISLDPVSVSAVSMETISLSLMTVPECLSRVFPSHCVNATRENVDGDFYLNVTFN